MFWKAGVFAGVVSLFFPSLQAYAEEGEQEKEPPRWAGSEISLTHNIGISTLDASIDQSYNPLVVQALSIDPRWRINKKLSLSAHLGLETELTNSDVTSTEREPLLEDIYVQGSLSLPRLPGEIGASTALRITFPTSKASLARHTIFSISPSINLNRTFKLSSTVSLQPFFTLRPSFTVATNRELTYDAPTIPWCANPNLDNCDQVNHSGSRSAWGSLNEVFGVNVGLPKNLTAQVIVWFAQSFLYELTPIPGVEPTDGPNTRYLMIYLIQLDWEPTKHLRFGGGFQTINEQLAPDSTYYAPFFNRWTQVFLKGTYVF